MIGAAEIRNARILIVDDSAVNVTLLTRMLDGAGYTDVTSTTRSTEVCALYEEQRYDLILLDLMMPDMDGFEVLDGLRAIELEGYVPVVVLTAQPKHRLRALQAGARDFITKPFDQIEVLARIQNMLEARLLLLESRSHGKLLEQYDQLTGLPNRRRYRELLIKALARPEAPDERVSVLFLSVDRFHVVNDVLGRTIGGVMLTLVADRLLACLSPMSTLARLEGAEFGVILVTPIEEPDAAEPIAQRLRETMRAPLEIDGHELAATLSIGVTVSPTDATETDVLLVCAARALGEARASGGDTVRYYSAESNHSAEESLSLEIALRGAIEREEFEIHYQPKMRVHTGDWMSAEALLRWDRPGHGPVAPSTFIRTLEDTGMIVAVGSWVLHTVCRQIAAWEAEGLGRIRIAVNVSSKQFARKGFVAEVEHALATYGVSADSLDIEITESSLMSRNLETESALRALKALGVQIALDDFGTGYSSLSYLRRYPIDTLKIDISFIRGITTDPDEAAIAVAIIEMARVLKMTVVAEGVETQEQLDFLRAHACDEIQGYLFSPPLPAADLASLRLASPVA
jgi:diguanylate cyclase (GGDEF)-like protein